MRIRSGKTRIVLLVGERAIKIAKVRIFRAFFRVVAFPFMSDNNHRRFFNRYGVPFCRAVFNYLIAGFHANRSEFEYWGATHDCRVAPTVECKLGCWIVIQKRGERITTKELKNNSPFSRHLIRSLSIDPAHLEIGQPWQFCRIGENVVLADYGRRETLAALRKSSLMAKATVS